MTIMFGNISILDFMSSLILLFTSLLIGLGLQRVKTLPANAHSTLGAIILYVPMPAICLLNLPHLEWRLDLLTLTLVPWILFGGAFFLFNKIGKTWDKSVVGCLILTAGLANTSFVGFPVLEALYGEGALKHALLLDQSGSFLIVSSLGVWVAITYSSGKMRKRVLLQKILVFPPFIAFALGIILGAIGWRAEGDIKTVLEKLSGTLTPLALICVGLQLKWGEIKDELRYLTVGLTYKLLIAPLIIFVVYYFLDMPHEIFRVAVMESAMAPMITASILAASHGLRPKLAGMMVGVGVPISFLTLGFWYFLIELLK